MKTLQELQAEFGARVCTLNTGAAGIRGGLACTVRAVTEMPNTLEFVGSDGTVDRYNEVIDPRAWGDMKNFKANPVIPDCHDYSSIAKILGRAVSVEVKDGKLINRVEFAMDNPMGALAYKMAKGGFINSQSVGFIPEEWTKGKNASDPDRTYTKCELLEISMVVVPANPGATIGLALKSGALDKQDLVAAAKFLGGLCGTHFCGDTDPAATGGTSGAGDNDVRLQMARRLLRVLAS
jgi:HK97 family phage prohead protease